MAGIPPAADAGSAEPMELYRRSVMTRTLAALLLILGAWGCGQDIPECVEINLGCQPLYEPTFENVFSRTLESGCTTGTQCHSAEGRRGGLVLAEQEAAHQQLLDPNRALVVPGDAACSHLIVRSESVGESWQMPPGDELSEGERCALVQWVAQGANP
jgi:hypothetical protein